MKHSKATRTLITGSNKVFSSHHYFLFDPSIFLALEDLSVHDTSITLLPRLFGNQFDIFLFVSLFLWA